jgi:ureidoglycolate lyase
MTRNITTELLTTEAFASFGDILEATGIPDRVINQGRCLRYHDRAKFEYVNGRAGISVLTLSLVNFR